MFIIVNKATKQPESWPDTSGLITQQQIQQWITDCVDNIPSTQELTAFHEPEARPNVEERYIMITPQEAYFDEAHPLYSNLKQWRKTYIQENISVENKLLAVEIVESQINETVIPTWKQLKTVILAFDSFLDLYGLTNNTTINATTLNDKKKKQLRVFKRAANKIRQNDTERDNKKSALTANPLSNPDLNSGWTVNDFTEEA
jgi:hypothetical protein